MKNVITLRLVNCADMPPPTGEVRLGDEFPGLWRWVEDFQTGAHYYRVYERVGG